MEQRERGYTGGDVGVHGAYGRDRDADYRRGRADERTQMTRAPSGVLAGAGWGFPRAPRSARVEWQVRVHVSRIPNKMPSSWKASFDRSQVSAIGRLFSSSVLRELAARGRSPLFARLAGDSGLTLARIEPRPARVRDLFDAAFDVLRWRDHRDEYIYKTALMHRVLLGTHSLATAAMLTEFRVGPCKADVVILNGTSTVYEIKSERDNLDRLQNQMTSYLQVFARVNVITGQNHLASILSSVPNEVGVLVLTDRLRISTVREAHSNLDRISPSVVFNSLQRDEAQRILEGNGCSIPALPNTQISQALKALFVALPPRVVHAGFVEVLKRTRSPLPLRDVLQSIPTSLQAAAVSVPLSARNRSRLTQAMDVNLDEALSWA